MEMPRAGSDQAKSGEPLAPRSLPSDAPKAAPAKQGNAPQDRPVLYPTFPAVPETISRSA